MTSDEQNTSGNNGEDQLEAQIERQLAAAGRRPQASELAAARARKALAVDWQAQVKSNAKSNGKRQRRQLWLASAAAIGLAAVALQILAPVLFPAPVDLPVAWVDATYGSVHAGFRGQDPALLNAGDALRAAAEVRTAADAGMIMSIPPSAEIRLDRNSRVLLTGERQLELLQGQMFVFADARTPDLRIISQGKTIQHIGTQFMVSSAADGVAVSVRQGEVRVDQQGAEPVLVDAGAMVRVAADGGVQTSPIAADQIPWAWADAMARDFDLEGAHLDAFLRWAARETGRQLVYDSPGAEATAAITVLHGAVKGLSVGATLDAVLASTALEQLEAGRGELRIRKREEMH